MILDIFCNFFWKKQVDLCVLVLNKQTLDFE